MPAPITSPTPFAPANRIRRARPAASLLGSLLGLSGLVGLSCAFAPSASAATPATVTTAKAPSQAAASGAGSGSSSGSGSGSAAKRTAPKTLDEYLERLSDPAQLNRQQRQIEEEVAACMRAEGFTYTPIDPAGRTVVRIESSGGDDPQRLREHGYGVTERLEAFGKLPAKVADDPNQSARGRMSEAERKAYDRALFGKEMAQQLSAARAAPAGSGAAKAIVINGGGPGGCRGKAEAKLMPDQGVFEVLGPKIEEFRRRYDADARVVAATQQWQACMRKAGYTYRDRDAIVDDLEREAAEITGAPAPPSRSGDGNREVRALVIGGKGAAALNPAKVSALRTREKAVASADADCSEPIASTLKKVRAEYEAAFVQENRSQLDRALR